MLSHRLSYGQSRIAVPVSIATGHRRQSRATEVRATFVTGAFEPAT
jgi:hypothetical protein